MPKTADEAKRKVAMGLLEYLTEERTCLEEDPEEYEEVLEEELPKVDDQKGAVKTGKQRTYSERGSTYLCSDERQRNIHTKRTK